MVGIYIVVIYRIIILNILIIMIWFSSLFKLFMKYIFREILLIY